MNDYITHSSVLEEIGRNIREKTEHNQKSISDFNIMRFVRKNEMGLSAILAFFLDPNESHKQRDFFLKKLLKEIAREDFLDYESVSVETEKITINRRRHDIFIEGRKNNKGIWGICIENKLLGAGDAENQLSDYIKDLRTLYNENFFVIYLTRNKRPPSRISILEEDWDELNKANKAKIFDPEDIIRILSEKTLEKDNIDFFHHDFIAFLRTLMFQEKIPPSWVKNITNNQNLVKTSIELIENQEFIYHSLIEILIKQLNNKCEIFDSLIKNGFKI
ncbi:MAG: PD-(D/E)XK nuclease family protein [Cardiobacteriaceae bacterium]|nr:PD-(D/E)XK nuclease family protein [Cardiobacteriaceae bacterium]